MKRIKGRDGAMREVHDGYVLASGESYMVPSMMMDSGTTRVHDGNGHTVGCRPGYLVRDDDVAHAVRETVYRTVCHRCQRQRDVF